MRHPLRALALACALPLTPACASLDIGETRLENPASAARTLDQRAYALLNAYAAVIEEATDIVRDANAPPAFIEQKKAHRCFLRGRYDGDTCA